MNPPYSGSLHLKILQEAMKHSDEIVNLSPIRWLQDPLAGYKKSSDWERFADIRGSLVTLDEISAEQAQKYFGSGQYENLGIYVLNEKGGLDFTPKPFISQALFDKVNLPTYQGKYKSLYDVRSQEGKPDFNRPFARCSVLHGNVGTNTWADIITPQKEIAYSKESRSKGSANFTFNFDTDDERDNFYKYTQTTFVRACNANVKTNIRWPGYAIPFMPDYTHPWTDSDLYEYFNLTDDEIAIIEKEMK